MSSEKDQILIAYCLKQGYLSMDQIKEFLTLKSHGKSLLSLVARHLGWDKARIVEALNKADNKTTHLEGDAVKADDSQCQKLGKYVLVEKIGAGGMGAVYKAYHPELGTYFAIKTILPGHINSDEIERFKREARISSQLKHPNIVQVYDVGLEGEQYYIVMEYIDGKDITRLIQEENLYPRKTFKIILKVVQALEYAHEKRVIHRDIKPSNILVTRENVPYLMDFGLASVIQENTRITQSGQLLGTPMYMSPEQAAGKTRRLDGRSDIYSLGAVLYEMLTGKPVVKTANNASVLYKVIHEEPVPLSRHDPNIPKDVEAICLKCLEKEPVRRYQSAHEFSDDIQRYLRGYAIHARPATALSRLVKWIQRNKAIGIIITAAVSLIFIINFLYILELKQERDRTKEALEKAEAEKENAQYARRQAEDALKKYMEADKSRKEAQTLKKKQEVAMQIIDEVTRWASEKRALNILENKFKEAENEAPFYSGVYRAWGKVYYEYGNREKETKERSKLLHKGLEMLDKTTRLSDDDYVAWFYKHLIFQTLGDNRNADRCISKVAELNLNNEYGSFGQGVKFENEAAKITTLEKKMKFLEKALSAYTLSIQYNKEFAMPYNNRGKVYKEMNRCKEAMEDYNKAISLDPSVAQPYNNRGNIYREANRYEEAMEDFNKTISLDPNYAIAYNNRGNIYYTIKRYKEAMEDYSKTIALDPNEAYAYYNRGGLYKDMNRYKEAIYDFSQAIILDPSLHQVYITRGMLYCNTKMYEEAIEDFNKAVSLNSDLVQAYSTRGVLYCNMKRYEEAMKDFDKTIALNPNYTIAYINRGNIYKDTNRHKEAMEDYNKAITLDPNTAPVYNNRGILYYNMKRYEEATEDFNKALTLNPNLAQAYHSRGDVYNDTKRYKEAIEDYSKAIECNSNIWQIYAKRGILYYNLRQYSKAMIDLEQCRKLGIEDPGVEQYIRLCREAMGHR